ncbi:MULTISPECIES: DUF3630 family protein [unclassified Pseudomonas]|jgi:hypothetical protein|uniref:DUF3630 family protein n=1 Tax=unclassified Pseudomonas TaxID=196821 RepID=UPI0003E5024F|nr:MULTISPECIES: DUF3630 family protein [unclassified Pseudomonas]MBB1604929.1 hypothetical protein [Pseudomonas sp. UMC76]MBB1641878.1 hypothetical protein [Pseudomonas sp. UME83]NTX90326.1 DUF3630 family protein [Pseudomonas sp. UMA643]NTY21485.1 DUF3630 family protein [Pseudomonas sp. UMC3103]NTY25597.1 DUF3630 family protein [Pseudomonas sp. UMA603]
MMEIEISESADWQLFENVAQVLEQGLGGYWKEKLDETDQRYWDLAVGEQILTLHLEHYLGISMLIPDSAHETAQRVRTLLKLD